MTPAMRGFMAAFETPFHFQQAVPNTQLTQEEFLWLIVKAKRAQPIGYALAMWITTGCLNPTLQRQINQALAKQENPELWITLKLNLYFSHLEYLIQREEHSHE